MIKIRIGTVEKSWEEAGPGWINQEINRRRKNGEVVCARVSIDTPSAKMGLATPTCAAMECGGRPPNPLESRIFELWDERGLNRTDFAGGHLIAFLHRLRDLL